MRPGSGKTIVFNAASPVSFVANSAAFLAPAEASPALLPIARWLRADPRRRATITGTTMNYGSYPGQVHLSLARARATEKVLCAAGASPGQITVRGPAATSRGTSGRTRPPTAAREDGLGGRPGIRAHL